MKLIDFNELEWRVPTMTDDEKLIQSLREAVSLAPHITALRIHLANFLFKSGKFDEAEAEYRVVLSAEPSNSEVKLALAQSFYHQQKWMMALVVLEDLMKEEAAPGTVFLLAARAYLQVNQRERATKAYRQAVHLDSTLADAALDEQTSDKRIPVFVEAPPEPEPEAPKRSGITFQDVGGMEKLKEQIRLKIIHPLDNPTIYAAYGKSIGGGILMYGPPGCGKTYLARATAGEVDASFVSIGIHDVLNMWMGQSERNLHELFEVARRNRPSVLFIDEVDALGASRSDMRQSAGRHLINQLLAELDGMVASNDGMLVLAASNAPWHIDSALRRPGRFDRVIFVPPPDLPARAAILQVMLRDKPIDAIDYDQIARKTEGFSGADLKGLIDSAIESKLNEALKKGIPIPLTTKDLLRAAADCNPTTKEWFGTARNYALFSNQNGAYDDVLEYLKSSPDSGLFSRWRDK